MLVRAPTGFRAKGAADNFSPVSGLCDSWKGLLTVIFIILVQLQMSPLERFMTEQATPSTADEEKQAWRCKPCSKADV